MCLLLDALTLVACVTFEGFSRFGKEIKEDLDEEENEKGADFNIASNGNIA